MNADQQIVVHTRGQQRREPSGTAIVPDVESANAKIVWEFWRITQSQYHRREIGIVDLGEIE